MRGLGILYIILGAFFLFIGWFTRVTFVILIGFCIYFYLWLISKRLRVEWLSDQLICQGWLKKREVPLSEIISVKSIDQTGWPKNRLYWPSTYEIRTNEGCLLINLLYFSREFKGRFRQELLKGSGKKRG